MNHFFSTVASPLKLVSCRRNRTRLEHEDKAVPEDTTANNLLNILHRRDFYELIRSFSENPCLSELSKTIQDFESSNVSPLCYYHRYFESCFLLKRFNSAPYFIDSFNSISNNHEPQRLCLLPDQKDVFFLEDMWRRCNHQNDMAIKDIPPTKLKFKDRSRFWRKKGCTPLKSIWWSYCEQEYRTVLAFSLPDEERISFLFVYALFDFARNMTQKRLETLISLPEFVHARYFVISKPELSKLCNRVEFASPIYEKLRECKGLQGLSFPILRIQDQDFFQNWPNITELRISSVLLDENVVFNVNELQYLQIMQIGIKGSFPIDIRVPSLIHAEFVLANADSIQRVVIGQECLSLKTLIFVADENSAYLIDFPMKASALEHLYVHNCIGVAKDHSRLLNYEKLKELTICDDESSYIHFYEDVPMYHKVVLGGARIEEIQLPPEAPTLHILGFQGISLFSSSFIPSLIYPALSELHISGCVMNNLFVVPHHFPMLRFVLFHKCTMGDIKLPAAWAKDIRIEFIDWYSLNDVYDCSDDVLYDIYVEKDGNQYFVYRDKRTCDLNIAKVGTVFHVVEQDFSETIYCYFYQYAYFDQNVQPYRPVPLPPP